MNELTTISTDELIEELQQRSKFMVMCAEFPNEKESYDIILWGSHIEKGGAINALNKEFNNYEQKEIYNG